MRLLFIGDIVGPAATQYVARRLPELRADYAIDLVVANAENCVVSGPDPQRGYGMNLAAVELLLGHGVDLITSGNHAWDSPESELALAHPRVLRPLNVPSSRPGRGALTLELAGEPFTLLNLADAAALPEATPAYAAWCELDPHGSVVVDFHGASVQGKHEFAYAADGKVAAVIGTHTHEPTLHLHLLPGGTAFVADVGMTGPTGGILGVEADYFVAALGRTPDLAPSPFSLASGPITLGAVIVTIEGGLARELVRIS